MKHTDYERVLDNKKLEPFYGCWNDLRYSAIRECKLLAALAHDGEHPHIVKYLDHAVNDEKKHVYLVMEYPANCMSLNYYLHIHMREILKSEDGPKRERFARELLRQVVAATGYCHEHFIVHRDLKLV